MGRFQELAQCIFELPSLKPIIKHESLEEVVARAYVKGVSYMWGCVGAVRRSVQVVKMSMVKLNSFLINPNSSRFLEWA